MNIIVNINDGNITVKADLNIYDMDLFINILQKYYVDYMKENNEGQNDPFIPQARI